MKVSTEVVLNEVCRYYSITPQEMFYYTRRRFIVKKRQLFFFMCCKWTNDSLKRIGECPLEFSNIFYDHATVLHSRNVVQDFLQLNLRHDHLEKKLLEDVININDAIKHSNFKSIDLVVTHVDLLGQILDVNKMDVIYSEVVA